MPESRRLDSPRGRFAPSPTGPLHFGSLVAAVGSYSDARAAGGSWLLRMEDLDKAREMPGAADAILRTLERFGLRWDEAVVFQSQRSDAYADALRRLRDCGLTFPCACSRAQIAAHGRVGLEGPIYPGTCRNGLLHQGRHRSERLRVNNVQIAFEDRVHGPIEQHLARDVGDFVLHRADGIHAYQLAVVVDDAAAGIDTVVRGADLLMSTPRQVHLQRLLGLPQPSYAHLPLAVDDDGHKLSKSLASAPVDPDDPLPALLHAWQFLGQLPLPEVPGSVPTFWQLALPLWSIARVPPARGLPAAPGRLVATIGRTETIAGPAR